ncbi:unnamed protein product [Amoebophrya sp. A120]|nr:unnamed protein product [Amoebophrya sp. A120]|eukprot:GSA120T00012802001.1
MKRGSTQHLLFERFSSLMSATCSALALDLDLLGEQDAKLKQMLALKSSEIAILAPAQILQLVNVVKDVAAKSGIERYVPHRVTGWLQQAADKITSAILIDDEEEVAKPEPNSLKRVERSYCLLEGLGAEEIDEMAAMVNDSYDSDDLWVA